jgi:hypothetical protein
MTRVCHFSSHRAMAYTADYLKYCPATKVDICTGKYEDGTTALMLYTADGEPHGRATICLEGHPVLDVLKPKLDLRPDDIVIKNYAENTGIYEWLLKNGIVGPARRCFSLDGTNDPATSCVVAELLVKNS